MSILRADGWVDIVVADDGVGFADASSGGVGLRIVRELCDSSTVESRCGRVDARHRSPHRVGLVGGSLHLVVEFLDDPVAVMLLYHAFHIRIDMAGNDDEPVRSTMGSLELIDSSLQSPNAIGIATLTHPRCRLGDDRMFFHSDPAIVVVAKRLLILHQTLSTKIIPVMLGHPALQSDFTAAG